MYSVWRVLTHLKIMFYILVASVLLLSVACGAASKPAAPAAAPQKEAPVVKATPTKAPVARATPVPAAAAKKPTGKVTILNANWSNELFSTRSMVGENAIFGRQLHAFWIGGNERVQMVPGALTEWKVSADGLTWDLKVRKGIKFHNGEVLDLDRALWAFQYTFGPESIEKALSPSIQTEARATKSIEAVGTDTVRITHATPKAFFPFFISEMGFANPGSVMPRDYVKSVGEDGYNKAPVGAGPYKLVKHDISQRMLFERFVDYYNPAQAAAVQTLDLRLVPEVSTRVAALQAGDADLIEANLAVQEQVKKAGGRLIFASEASYQWVIFPDCELDVWCKDKRVRQALDYAIDKQTIVKKLYGPEAAVAKGWVHATPSALGYFPGLDPFPFDPKKAQQLLAEAGYPGGKGFPKFKIHTWVAGDLPFLPEQAQIIASMWKANLGIDAEVKIGEAATVREQWYNNALAGDVLIRTNESRWDGGSINNALYGDPKNRAHIGAQRADIIAAAAKANKVVDPAQRQAAFEEFYRLVYDEHYEFSTMYVNLPWGAGPRVVDWKPWPVSPYLTALWTLVVK